jgi:tetratricopeptide (TPR) repeat protein
MNPVARKLVRWWLNNQASAALILGGKSIAKDLYERMVQLDPNDALALSSLGNLRMEAGDSIGAVSAFVDLVERHPNNADAWFNLGFIYEQREDLAPAEKCLREAVRLDPKLDRAWYGLALVLIRTDRLNDAVDALKANIKLQPMSPYGYYQLGMTQHHLGQAEDARRVVEELRRFEPKYAATLERDIAQTPSRAGAAPAGPSSGGSAPIQLKEALHSGA